MRVIDRYEHAGEEFPYFYLAAYGAYIKSSQAAAIVFITDAEGNSICCKTWKNKFLGFMQPLYPPLNAYAQRLTKPAEKIFLERLVIFVKEKKLCDRMVQPENFAVFTGSPLNAVSSPFASYVIELQDKSEAMLFENLHAKHRNVIRNAEKNNVVLKYGAGEIDNFYFLYAQTMRRSNMHCQPGDYFKGFYRQLPQNTICGVAYFNEIPQGALFMPFTNFGSFYLYGASAGKIAVNGAMNYLHWNTIKLLKSRQVKRYDFVGARLSDVSGTKLEGIQNFKKRFGADLVKGYLWKKDINKIKCSAYDRLLKMKCSLRGLPFPADIIDQERQKLAAW